MEKPNLNYIKQLSGGDIEFEKKITHVIKQEFKEELEVYRTNFELKDFKKLTDNVHKLKHKISILGLEKSYTIAVDYENNLRGESLELSGDFDQIMVIMTKYINNL